MNEKIKSPSQNSAGVAGSNTGGSSNATSTGSPASGLPIPNNGNDQQTNPHPYGPSVTESTLSHYHLHQPPHSQHISHQPSNATGIGQNPSDHQASKDEYNPNPLSAPPPPPGGHHPVYGRFHHGDPNIDPYRYGHSMQQPPPGGKPQSHSPSTAPSGTIPSPGRPSQQRYIPGQPPQGPTPTLNSLLQSSHPPPTQHRYSNSYDAQQQVSPQQPVGPQGAHVPPPPSHQSYPTQQGGWAPPPRPYSPQLGPSQAYRTPPPANASRGQSSYPSSHGQNAGSYPSSPQQSGGPPPQSSNQGTVTSQYTPYPQRYPTPPAGPNHRNAFSTHQYPDPNRPWPGGSSPAPSPGAGNHPHPPASPHQSQHGGPQPSSPGHAPSPSPQPSPQQELIGQNSNDSSSGGGHSSMPTGPPGTPNPQQVMRPTPSPTSSSGSRSMSPAVAQNHPASRPSSNQSSSSAMPQQGNTGQPPSHVLQNTSGQQPLPPTQLGPGGPSGVINSSPTSNNSQQPMGSNIPSGVPQQPQPPPNQNVNNTPPPPQSSYIQPSHIYKMGVPGPSAGQNAGPVSQGYSTPQQSQQYTQGNYPPRPQYPPSNYTSNQAPTSQPIPTSNMPPGAQPFSGRPIPNHGGSNPHAQYPYQNWVSTSGTPTVAPSGAMGNHVQGKGTPPPLGVPPHQGSGSPRPLNYLKQHLQHKGGYANSPTPPQGYGNGSPMHAAGMPMGPPHHMGPPSTNMGPPVSTPPQSIGGSVPVNENSTSMDHLSQDNGISSSSSSATSGSHPVTSVITTGPDGTPMDEVSQQSTLSNASAASGEDPQCTTPKSRKSDPYSQSHLAPPCTSPSSHPGHPAGGAEDYEMNSPPNWTRTAASPVFNSHVPSQESFRSSTKKSDSLCKLYEMDENPERRGWLDKLRAFMEERRTPITACPTISKQPLDLYRLYIYVKERGGFVEVTKSKTWKDIAGLLGIGASSSAAYTLRKHYTKNLLAFECHFDRGDIDPLPIIQQVEAGTKKKTTKAVSVPSPGGGMMDAVNPPSQTGSSNSQDSFTATGAAPNTAMEGYPGYPAGYPNATQTDYNAGNQLQRPSSQANAQAPHPGSPYPGQAAGYGQYSAGDQYNATGPPAQFPQNQAQFAPQNRNMYPYGPEAEPPPTGSNQYGPYGNRHYSPSPSGGAQTPNPSGGNVNAANVTSNPVAPTGSYSPGPPAQPDYYRPPEQPRRHPDFVKDSQPYPGYNTRPQIYGWQAGSPQYRGQYPTAPSPQTWVGAPRAAGPPTGPLGPPAQQPPTQWEQHRYSPQQAPQPQQSPYQQQNQQQPPPQWAQMGGSQSVQPGPPGSPIRPPGGQQQQRMPTGPGILSSQQAGPQMSQNIPSNVSKQQFSMPPPQSNSGAGVPPNPVVLPPSMVGPPKAGGPLPHASGPGQQTNYQPSIGTQLTKKDINFPPDSVEATTAVLYRRKRLNKADICPVDPWRLFMAMRSGLLTECTWALDVLNILLFDDTTVQYFGLAHLPGLLTLLLEHFQKNLAEMFNDIEDNRRVNSICSASANKRKRHYEDDINNESIDLGQITDVPKSEDRILLLSHTPNYTMLSRKGLPVRITPAEDDIFISDEQKSWDIDTDKLYEQMLPIGSNPWTYGLSEHSSHDGIIDVFKSEIINIPFARHIKRSCDSTKDDSSKAMTNGYKGKDNESPQQILNKKRRLFNNSKTLGSTTSTPSFDQCNSNASSNNIKSTNDNTSFVQPVIKKEAHIDGNVVTQDQSTSNSASDSDCREVDMDIEVTHRISHGNKIEISSNLKNFDPKSTARDPSLILKRRRDSSYEDECYTRDEASLYLVNESQDSLARRCICISNIFRNLTFIPGNETILAKSSRFLAILGRLLLLNHDHLQRTPKTRNYDREEDTDFSDSCSSLQGECEWWWDYLISIRENMLVAMANIAGHLELSRYEELIARPLIDGLLHWAVCPSAHSQDPFPSCGTNSALSPQRLALEALCKLCVTDANVDLVIATPPHSRLEKLCAVLTRHLCRNEDQVLREFSVNLLHYLAAADSAMARTVALQSPCISYLVAFIEQAEQTALGVANQHGINYLRETPESMGTSLDMLRRAAGTLLHLAKHPDNRSLFMQQEQRLLGLVMSHILDQQVALIISRVLFQVSRGPGPLPSMEFRLLQRQQKGSNESKPNKNATIKAEVKPEVVQPQKKVTPTPPTTIAATVSSIIAATTTISSSNSNTNTISSVAVTDENSNSSNHLPSAVNFNDVSNSSTNSNSCGTTSSQSNVSSNSNTGNKSNLELTAAVNDTSSSDHHETILGSSNKNLSTTSGNLETASYNNNGNSNSNNNTEVSINTDSNMNSSNSNNAGLTSTVSANAAASSSAPPPPPSTTTTAVA